MGSEWPIAGEDSREKETIFFRNALVQVGISDIIMDISGPQTVTILESSWVHVSSLMVCVSEGDYLEI
jgi:hypothetical protein